MGINVVLGVNADIGRFDRRVVAHKERDCSLDVSVLVWAARGRKRPRPGAIARPFGPRDRAAFGVSAHSCDAPCRWYQDRRDWVCATDANVVPDLSRNAQYIGQKPSARPLRACSRARSCQGRALRVAAKAASLDSSCARLPEPIAGRDGETGFRSNRETGTGQRRRGVRATARFNRRFFSSFSTAPRQDRRGVVVKCLEIVFCLIRAFSENDAFTISWKERTMNSNCLVGSVEGLVMARQKRLRSRPLRDRRFRKVRSFRASPILCWRSTSRQARHRERLTLAASAQDLRHPRLWWGVS